MNQNQKYFIVGSRIEKVAGQTDEVRLIIYLAKEETRFSYYRNVDILTQAFIESPSEFDECLTISFLNQGAAEQFLRLQSERVMGTKIVPNLSERK